MIPSPMEYWIVDQPEEETHVSGAQSGVGAFKQKGSETKASHFSEYKPAAVIKVLNVFVLLLKDEIANRRKTHEEQLEALQSIKQSFSAVEKRPRPARQRETSR